MKYNFNKLITTSEELKQYIGQPIYFGYPNEQKPKYAWIKTVTAIDNVNTFSSNIRCLKIWGLNTLITIKNEKKDIRFLHETDYKTPKMSNAQEFARTLTKEEFDLYKKMTIKRRLVPNWIKE